MVKLDLKRSKKSPKTQKLKSYQIDKGNQGIFDSRNRVNDFTGKQWTFSTRSVITKQFKNKYPDNWLSDYPGLLPLDLISDLICTFSKSYHSIFDPLANFGNILLAARSLNPPRQIFYDSLDKNLVKKLQAYFPNQFMEYLSHTCLIPSERVSLLFSQLVVCDFSNDRIKNQELLTNIHNKLKSYFFYVEKLQLNRYAILAYSNWLIQNNSRNIDAYFNVYNLISEYVSHSSLIPKGEIIWHQPHKSNSGLNETRIYVFRKEDNYE